MFRAVSRMKCGPVPGDKWKRVMYFDVKRGPLVNEERRAQLLKKVFDGQTPANQNVVQSVVYE